MAGAVSGGRVPAPFGRRAAKVIAGSRHGAYIVLHVDDVDGPRPLAGQFYMLAAAERWGGGESGRPYLPRAFSVLRAPAGSSRLEFMLADVGPGTARLGELGLDERLLLVGPLGNGFTAPRPGRRPLLVGGGIGIAPLAILQDQVESAGADSIGGDRRVIARAVPRSESAGAITLGAIPPVEDQVESAGVILPLKVLLGFRDARHAAGAELLRDAQVATDDGSAGHHGLVTELLLAELDGPAAGEVEVYACGPPPMLEAVRAICAERDVPGQLALESGMACGFGACFGCVVPTRDGYVRLCLEGPVLAAASLETALSPGAGH